MPTLGGLLKKKWKDPNGSKDSTLPTSPIAESLSPVTAERPPTAVTATATATVEDRNSQTSAPSPSQSSDQPNYHPQQQHHPQLPLPPPSPVSLHPQAADATRRSVSQTPMNPAVSSQLHQPLASSPSPPQLQQHHHHQNVASINNIIHLPQNDEILPTGQASGSFPIDNVQAQAALAQSRQTKGKYSLEDFVLQRTLGTGSFGRVHLVQSTHNHRFYAVKVLKKTQVVKMKQVEHTNDERKMLQRVKHPFLITLWGTFQDSKHLYMVMDFVEGGELFSLLRKSQRFPNPVAKFYAAEVTLALEYLHAHHIIYRDLKPENLLLDRHGHLKITDFGFAKEVPDITWTLCGTPDYLAPEVVSSKGYNKSVDWWSLGILIFEMLCGFTPFWDSGSPVKIYENIVRGKIKYPHYMHHDVVDLLSQLITPDLTKRLGNLHGGPEDVKRHSWFAEVPWDRLLKKDIDAPYVPPVRAGQGDTSQFDKYPEEQEAYGAHGEDPYANLFADF